MADVCRGIIAGKRCNFKKILLLGMDASIVIEVLQYALSCGKSETTDIVMNVAGAIIGYGIYRLNRWQCFRVISG